MSEARGPDILTCAEDVGVVDAVLGAHSLDRVQVDLGVGGRGAEADAALVLPPDSVRVGGEHSM